MPSQDPYERILAGDSFDTRYAGMMEHFDEEIPGTNGMRRSTAREVSDQADLNDAERLAQIHNPGTSAMQATVEEPNFDPHRL